MNANGNSQTFTSDIVALIYCYIMSKIVVVVVVVVTYFIEKWRRHGRTNVVMYVRQINTLGIPVIYRRSTRTGSNHQWLIITGSNSSICWKVHSSIFTPILKKTPPALPLQPPLFSKFQFMGGEVLIAYKFRGFQEIYDDTMTSNSARDNFSSLSLSLFGPEAK